MLNQTVEYAPAPPSIAMRDPSISFRASEVATAIDAPRDYVAKILGQLVRAGILESGRGPCGGFRLSGSPEGIHLADVVNVFGQSAQRRCLLGHGVCGETPSCVVHKRWAPIATSMNGFFADTTLADLLLNRSLT
jgi:Rrf2 family protein